MAKRGKNQPLLKIEDDTKKQKNYELAQGTINLVAQYAKFYTEASGKKTTEDQVVNATLAQLFGDDDAFQKWLKTHGDGAPSSTPSATPTSTQVK